MTQAKLQKALETNEKMRKDIESLMAGSALKHELLKAIREGTKTLNRLLDESTPVKDITSGSVQHTEPSA
jgi:hypothetical protein